MSTAAPSYPYATFLDIRFPPLAVVDVPKLVGESIGLHPLWLMFALFAFGYLFGFLGLLLAVPLAAAVGVLVRFAVDRYLHSPLYNSGAR